MKENNKESKGTKGLSTKAGNPEEEKQEKKMTEKKENGEKGHGEEAAIQKLMAETKKKLSALATDIEMCPRKKYTGWKLGSRLLVTIGPRKLSFDLWIYEYNKSGNRTSIEHFEIKSTSKDVGVVIAGLIKQVKKNYDILTAAKGKKAEPKKEAVKKEEVAPAA